jgi:hypothetical protein
VHAGYFVRYMGAAAEFVVERYNASLPERGEPTVVPPTVSPPSPTAGPEGGTSGAEGLVVPNAGLVAALGLLLTPDVLGWVGL